MPSRPLTPRHAEGVTPLYLMRFCCFTLDERRHEHARADQGVHLRQLDAVGLRPPAMPVIGSSFVRGPRAGPDGGP